MWIKNIDWEDERLFVNLDCVTHIESGTFCTKPCTFLHMNNGEILRTSHTLEDFESILDALDANRRSNQ